MAVSVPPRWAAEGGLGFGDLRPATGAVGFVVGVDIAVLAVADATDFADARVPKVAVLHGLEPGPAMAERLADQCSARHNNGVPEFRVIGVQIVVDVVQSHSKTPAQWPALVTLA